MKDEERHNLLQKRQMKRIWTWIYILLGVAVLIAGFMWIKNIPPADGKYDTFASCIASSGATFYGAFWCPHCAAQKALFGNSVHLLPYHECSTADGNSQLQSCTDAGVQGYPTWVFKDGSRLSGEQSLQTLATKTGCTLPQ